MRLDLKVGQQYYYADKKKKTVRRCIIIDFPKNGIIVAADIKTITIFSADYNNWYSLDEYVKAEKWIKKNTTKE